MTPEIEMCCVCHVEQIEIVTDAEYVVEFGAYRDRTAIVTPGAIDGREAGYSQGRYVGPICAEAIAA